MDNPAKNIHKVRLRRPSRAAELEGELRETLKRYEMLFRATNDVLYDLNFHTSRVVWNDALQTQYGYCKDEPAGRLEWWASHIHPDDAMDVEQNITALLESDQTTWNHEYRFRKADGSYVDVRDRGYILRDKQGIPQRIIGSFMDISRQKQLERAKDEFSSLISHQLRTPLTVIQIYSALLADGSFGKLSAEQVDEVHKIHNSSVRLIELVNDILAISSIELQRVQYDPVAVDINTLIEACVDAVKPIADSKSIEIQFSPTDTIETFVVDPKLIEQILHNLLTNAIRYSPPVDGKVVVSIRPDTEGCVITVRDNGIGIPIADQPHIFDRFFRANNAVNSEEHGTGLGLYYVKLVASAFGGKVWFKSSRRSGTEFYLFIPNSLE